MSYWKKLYDRVENSIENALTKREQDIEKEPAPPHQEAEDEAVNRITDAVSEKVVEIVLAKLQHGDSLPAVLRPETIKSRCPVCGKRRTDNVLAGAKEEYLNFDGEFDRGRFTGSLTCRRCGINFDASPERIDKAKEEWAHYASTASEAEIRETTEKTTAEAYRDMYSYRYDDEKG